MLSVYPCRTATTKEEEKKRVREKKASDEKQKERNKAAKKIQKQQIKDSRMHYVVEDINRGLSFVCEK